MDSRRFEESRSIFSWAVRIQEGCDREGEVSFRRAGRQALDGGSRSFNTFTKDLSSLPRSYPMVEDKRPEMESPNLELSVYDKWIRAFSTVVGPPARFNVTLQAVGFSVSFPSLFLPIMENVLATSKQKQAFYSFKGWIRSFPRRFRC